MNIRIVWISAISLAACSLQASLSLAQLSLGTEIDLLADLNASILFSNGNVKFEYAEPPWRSKLSYPLDGYLFELSAESRLQCRVEEYPLTAGIRGRFAQDISVKGDVTDSDWEHDYRWGYSEHDGDADVSIWDVDCVFSIRPFIWSTPYIVKSIEAGLIIGYGEQSFDFLVKDGWGNYFGEAEVFSGKVSTYDTTFSGIRIGPYLQCQPISDLALRVEAIAIPNLKTESDAYWILREYRFWQEAEGTGTTIGVKCSYRVTEHFQLLAGINWVYLNADTNGKESGIFYEDGASYTDLPIVPYISADYFNLQLGLTAIF